MKEKRYIPVLFRLRERRPDDKSWKQGFIDSEMYDGNELHMKYIVVYNFENNKILARLVEYYNIKNIDEYSKEYNEIYKKIEKMIYKANVFEEEKSPWISFAEKKPEEVVNYSVVEDYGLSNASSLKYITEKVFVRWKDQYFIDCRRKFDDINHWMWNTLEGLGSSEDDNLFWMPIPALSVKDGARINRILEEEKREQIKEEVLRNIEKVPTKRAFN